MSYRDEPWRVHEPWRFDLGTLNYLCDSKGTRIVQLLGGDLRDRGQRIIDCIYVCRGMKDPIPEMSELQYRSRKMAEMEEAALSRVTKELLWNLLARIHRDGGHRRAMLGEEGAAEEADQIVCRAFQAIDGAKKLMTLMRNFLTDKQLEAEYSPGRTLREEVATIEEEVRILNW